MKIKFNKKVIAGLVGWALVDIVLTIYKFTRALIENVLQ